MKYNELIDYLLLQTKQGIQKSKYEKYIKDWGLVPEIQIRKDSTVWIIASCPVWVMLDNGRPLLFNMPSLADEDAREVFTEDVVQRHVDATIYSYSQTKEGAWIES